MKKQKSKRNKKYCISRVRQVLARDILSTTYFFHISCDDSTGAECRNEKYPLTHAMANRIISQKNTWAGMIAVFCDNGQEQYVKTEYIRRTNRLTRQEFSEWLDIAQVRLVSSANVNHICSSGFFIVPDCDVDIESQREAILSLFESYGPYDYMRTALAGSVREDKLKRLREAV